MKTIILLTGVASQQFALTELLKAHNPALSFRCAVTADDLAAIEPEVLRDARLLAFTTSVIVPESMLAALGHGAYNFTPARRNIRAGRRRISRSMTAPAPSARRPM